MPNSTVQQKAQARSKPKQSNSFHRHDHRRCIQRGVEHATEHCDEAGLQLTPIRQRVLEILLTEHRALGAYEILDQLRTDGFNSQPPVAYRALDFLVQHGFVHKVERLNAFIACNTPETQHAPTFLICRVCSAVAETHPELCRGALGRSARDAGFIIEQAVVEVEGLCPNCH